MIDERTGRQFGNHGTAVQAIEYALDVVPTLTETDGDPAVFLRAWREGDTAEEWPEFYKWLAEQERPTGNPPGIGRTELTAGKDAANA